MRIMKHISVNLSEEHLAQIAKTGKSPSEVIRSALDAYFNPPKDALKLIREHERIFRMPGFLHEERINRRADEHESRIDVSDMPDITHTSRICMPDSAHDLRTKALAYILTELLAVR